MAASSISKVRLDRLMHSSIAFRWAICPWQPPCQHIAWLQNPSAVVIFLQEILWKQLSSCILNKQKEFRNTKRIALQQKDGNKHRIVSGPSRMYIHSQSHNSIQNSTRENPFKCIDVGCLQLPSCREMHVLASLKIDMWECSLLSPYCENSYQQERESTYTTRTSTCTSNVGTSNPLTG